MKLYNDYNSYLKARFGCKVYKIGLDAGFTCPNRDGTKGSSGCSYCNDDGSRATYADPNKSVKEQLAARIEYLKEKYGAEKFIAYFQAFSNTYASVDKLKSIYDEVLGFEKIAGISIGTRPDTIDRDKLKLISSYKDAGYEVWMEYGLQSIHDKTLKKINRGHDFRDFMDALELTREFGIPVCVHIIIGLPGETRQDVIETAKKLTELKMDGVKIHLLHILKGSPCEKLYKEGALNVLSQDEYAELVCDFLENLSGDIIIQRLTGEGPRQNHIAPLWALDKTGTINRIEEISRQRGSRQGINCGAMVRS